MSKTIMPSLEEQLAGITPRQLKRALDLIQSEVQGRQVRRRSGGRLGDLEEKAAAYGLGGPRRTRRPLNVGVIQMDSGSINRFKTKRRKRKRPKSKIKKIEATVKSLKRNMPKFSRLTAHRHEMMCLLPSNVNERSIHEIVMWDRELIETEIQGLKNDDGIAFDFRSLNTSINMSLFFRLHCKNNATAVTKFRYALYACIDDDNESVLDNILEDLGDRGYSNLPVVAARSAATASKSVNPRVLRFNASPTVFGAGDGNPFHVPVFSLPGNTRKWKQLGKVRTAKIHPGDVFDIVWSKKKLTYKPEVHDQEPLTYMKGISFHLLLDMYGDLAHDSSNTGLVGRHEYQIDCEASRIMKVKYANALGLNEIVYSDVYPPAGTGYDNPNFAEGDGADIIGADK